MFKAFHMAYYSSLSNPFLILGGTADSAADQSVLLVGNTKWKGFRRRVDEISRIVGTGAPVSNA
jgi:hypothetical protein